MTSRLLRKLLTIVQTINKSIGQYNMKNERYDIDTVKLYESDSYVRAFDAEVISCSETKINVGGKETKAYAVVLTATAFFPEGGGQYADKGVLSGQRVLDVQITDEGIMHYVEKPLEVGATVHGEIDWAIRFSRMQKHSGEHLLCGIIHNEYGYDNEGFHLTDEGVTLDVNGALSEEQISVVELLANKAIYENVPIVVSYPESDELAILDYRSKLELADGVRLVTIEGYDVCACCAPHVARTGEIGCIKVIEAAPHRGGTRITMTAGIGAFEDYSSIARANKSIMAVVSSKRYETASFVAAMQERMQKLQSENTALKKEITGYVFNQVKADILARDPQDMSPVLIFTDALDDVQLRNVINECCNIFSGRVAGFLGNDINGYRYIISCKDKDQTLPAFAKELNQTLDGRGGGNQEMIQGQVKSKREAIEKYMKAD